MANQGWFHRRLRPRVALLVIVLGCLLTSSSVEAQWWRWFRPRQPVPLIPASRLTTWTPGTYVGVPGGIPTTRTQCVTTECQAVTNASAGYKDDTLDAKALIQAAITSALSDTYVLLPAGTWKLLSGLSVSATDDAITLRGAGESTTTLNCAAAATCLFVGSSSDYQWTQPTSNNVVTAYTTTTYAGDTLTMADTSAFTVGQLLQFKTSNDPTLPVLSVSGYPDRRKQITRLVSKTSSTLTVFPPIYGYERFKGLTSLVNRASAQTDGFGLEDMTLDGAVGAAAGALGFLVWFEQTADSWVKNTTLIHPDSYDLYLNDSLHCEVRHSRMDELVNPGLPNGAGILMNTVSACLVEDNIIVESFPNIEINDGSSGNVFAYNFLHNDGSLFNIDSNHGPHNAFNLYEGNVSGNLISDGYFGGESELTIFRNLLHGNGITPAETDTYCLSLKRLTRNASIVGNVLGSVAYGSTCYGYGLPNIGNGNFTGTAQPSLGDYWADWNLSGPQIIGTLTTRTSDTLGQLTLTSGAIVTGAAGVLYQADGVTLIAGVTVGTVAGNLVNITAAGVLPAVSTAITVWPGSIGFQEKDLDVAATVVFKANYNVLLATIEGDLGRATMPDSLFRSSKPSFFHSLTWPPVNPNTPVLSYTIIPAGYRYVNGVDPS